MSTIYGIIDPRIEGEKNIIYVGMAENPETAIPHLFIFTKNPSLLDWIQRINQEYPEGLIILYTDEEKPKERYSRDGRTYLYWRILGFTQNYKIENSIKLRSDKRTIIHNLLREGYPLKNGTVGRPRKELKEEN